MSGPRRHRPTSLHLGRSTGLVVAMRRRRRRDGVRTGDGSGELRPLAADDPAALRAIEAARRLVDAAPGRQID
jgi:hypothetical protein